MHVRILRLHANALHLPCRGFRGDLLPVLAKLCTEQVGDVHGVAGHGFTPLLLCTPLLEALQQQATELTSDPALVGFLKPVPLHPPQEHQTQTHRHTDTQAHTATHTHVSAT